MQRIGNGFLAASLVIVLAVTLATGDAALAAPSAQAPTAAAELINAEGDVVGLASFSEGAGGVRIDLVVNGLPPGPHGIHIHDVARCTPPAFTDAGDHFNPARLPHGFYSRAGPHAGDLPVLIVAEDGTALYRTLNPMITLGLGNPAASLFDGNGTALVIHAYSDDHTSQPSGESGPAIACGPIRR